MRAWAGLGLAALLAACADGPSYPTTQTAPVPAAAAQAQPPEPPQQAPSLAPRPEPSAPLRSPIPQPSASDQCGAAQAQLLVGRSRTLIPVPVDPRRQRVACTTCPVTEDFDPSRLNFFFDAQSGLIRQIRCG